MSEREARLALAAGCEGGTPQVAALVAEVGAAKTLAMLRAAERPPAWGRRALGVDAAAVERLTRLCGARFVIPGDAEWPDRLDALAAAGEVQGLGGAPLGLWLRGPLGLGEAVEDAVAVVGARAATSYGETVAAEIASGCAARGVAVLSGGAYGIDAAAHRGALAADGTTIAVVASGVDVAYPTGLGSLFERIAAAGLIVSERPPGSHPTRYGFLARNRILAALARATVLVEAAARSGAKNTVNWAARCGRLVMAVPGPVHSALSLTPHRLIRDGEAGLVTGPEEVLELLAPLGQRTLVDAEGEGRALDLLTDPQRRVLDALPARGSLTAGEAALLAGLSMPAALAALQGLAEAGLAAEDGAGWRLAERRPGEVVRHPRGIELR